MRRSLFKRLRISRVRLAALAAGVAMFVALPLGILAIDRDEPARPSVVVVVRGPTPSAAPRPAQSEAPPRGPIAHPTPAEANLRLVERVRALSTGELEQLVKSGGPLEQLSALHVLWVRGERAHAEALVAASGDRALVAKLDALRARTK